MTFSRLPAPCGILCRSCRHRNEGCAGCHAGGGEATCAIRTCAQQQNLQGCWQCGQLPCDKLLTSDPAWRGLTIGLCQCIAAMGPDRYADEALATIGEYAEYGELRFLTPEQVRDLIRSHQPTPKSYRPCSWQPTGVNIIPSIYGFSIP